MLHLHHLSHLQTSARSAYPDIPRITTLHGTELKLIDGMDQRLRLARRTATSMGSLACLLHADNPHRQTEADRLTKAADLDQADRDLLVSTAWQKWTHSRYWLDRLRQAALQAGLLVAVSEHDQELSRRLLPIEHDPEVIANGVDTHTFRPQQLEDRQRMDHLRHWLVTNPRGWAPGGTPGSIRYTEHDLRRLLDDDGRLRPLLLWVGRFLHFKRLPVLLHAFAAARSRLHTAPRPADVGRLPRRMRRHSPRPTRQRPGHRGRGVLRRLARPRRTPHRPQLRRHHGRPPP
ncbi:hypothetical protein GCM10020000_86950 [Streptomyces olivoverticillatus]